MYDRLGKDSDAILVLCISSTLSGTFQSARLGIQDASTQADIHVIDSCSASPGLGLQVRRARELIETGMAIEEIAQVLERETSRYQLVFFADTLEYLQRGGRIGRASMVVGSLLKVKPVLAFEEGHVVPVERTRTRSRAINGLVASANANHSVVRIGVLHDGRHAEDLAHLLESIRGLAPDDEVYVNQYGPIIATHVGPGALGFCAFRHES